MTETFTTSGGVKLKAGANVSTALTGANYTTLINQAEALINVSAKIPSYNLVDNYSALDATVKTILEDAASSYAAISAIAYNPSTYNPGEATYLTNVNWSKYLECMKLIKEKAATDWMQTQ